MPVFVVQVFKNLIGNDREWTNVYHVRADTMEAVVPVGGGLASMEQDMHLDNVLISRVRVSDSDPTSDAFVVTSYGFTGDRATAADGDWLPLFNTIRVDIGVAGGGRPSRKYYRSPIRESDQNAGILDVSVRGLFDGKLADIITAGASGSTPFVDVDDQEWLTPVTQARVQMRQLHRKRRRTP